MPYHCVSRLFARPAALLVVLLLAGVLPHGQTLQVFGPRVYTRAEGPPERVTEQFPVSAPGPNYLLRVVNDGVASALVTLNGQVVLEPSDFGPERSELEQLERAILLPGQRVNPETRDGRSGRPEVIERRVSLDASNTVVVEIRSRPGTHLTLTIEGAGAQNEPPVVSIGADRTVTQQDGALVHASVSDDGRLPGGAVTCAWSVPAAPPGGRVSFEPRDAPDTRVLFSKLGEYVLRLTATDGVLSAYDEVRVTVTAEPPNASPVVSAGRDLSTNVGRTISLRGTVTDDGRPAGSVSVEWIVVSAPPGGSAAIANPAAAETSVVFSALGTYVLRLTATDGELSAWDETSVSVVPRVDPPPPPPPGNRPPAANAGGPYTGTAGQPVVVAGWGTDPDGDPLTFAWTFSDGGTATGAAATHIFATAGSYTATVSVSDGRGGAASATAAVTVAAAPPTNHPPTANAGGPYVVSVGQALVFTGAGSDADGDPVTFAWIFGDGATAAGQTATHSYSTAGSYVATLAVSDGRGATATATAPVTVNAPIPGNHPPTAAVGGPYTGLSGQAITLAAAGTDSDGDPLVYVWSFSDGAVATGATVSHVFQAAGGYTAMVTVSDGRGGSATANAIVTVNPLPPGNHGPTANAGGPYSGTAGYAITFQGAGTDPDNDLLTFSWNFSDGGSATGPAVEHAFAGAGRHSATLTVNDGRGGTATGVAAVLVSAPQPGNQPPSASAGGPYTGTLGQAITFTASATDPDSDPLAYAWSFSDGGTASGATVTHAFAAAGNHTAILVVSDGRGGTTDATAAVTVTGSPSANQVPAAGAGGPYSGTAGFGVVLTGSGSDPDDDPLTYSWTFSDGGAAAGANATHTFATAGPYTATLTVSDGRGGTATSTAVVTVTAPTPGNEPPTVNAGGPYSGTAGQAVQFAGTATDPDNDVLSCTWSFSDGGSGTGAALSHAFTAAGRYTATLTVSDGRGGTTVGTATVTVTEPPAGNQPPSANAGGPYAGTAGSAIVFAGVGSDPDGDALSFNWTFSDGGSATGAQVAHVFVAPGPYTATLTVTDGRGGTTVATALVSVTAVIPGNRAPSANAGGPYSGTANQSIAFAGSGTDPDNDPLSFEWGFGDGGTAAGASAVHTFAEAGSYTVTLMVSDGRGGAATATSLVVVAPPAGNQPPIARLSAPASGTVGQVLSFDGRTSTDPDGDSLVFAWSFGDGATGAGAAVSHAYAVSGTFTVTLTVSDDHGHSSSVTAATRIDPPANRPPTANAGGPYTGEVGTPVVFSGAQSRDADGDALSYSWNFGDGSSGVGQAPAHPFAAAGTFSVTLTVTDTHNLATTATATVTVTAAPDRAPPIVSLTAPREALPGAQVTLAAAASDNVGVDSVVIQVEGEGAVTFTAAPYQRLYTLPSVASPGAVIRVTATARDAAGNTATAGSTITVSSQPDTESPTVSMNAPSEAAAGGTVAITADAHDNTGVASVTLLVDGVTVTSLTVPPYQFSWPVPSSAQPGNSFVLVVRAADYAGHTTDATASLGVSAVPDGVAPSVVLSMPQAVTAGSPVQLSATASDNVGVSAVTFLVEGATVATIVTPPYQATYLVPAGLPGGATLHVEARAVDGVGLTGSDSRTATVATTAAPGEGIVFGTVYDDRTGLPVEAVTVTARGAGGDAYSQSATTDSRGRYILTAPQGQATLLFARAGLTTVNRVVAIVADGQARRVFDARLTPLAPGTAVAAVMGGMVSRDGHQLRVPGGALAADTSLALTSIGAQGLQGGLPAGWSPVAGVDVTPHGVAFGQPATLVLAGTAGLPAGTDLLLAAWDEGAGAWRAVTAGKVPADAAPLEAVIPASGQFAWLLADTTPAAPPQPAAGALLAGVAGAVIPDAVAAVVSPDPQIIFYGPGVRSLVTGTITTVSTISSGAPVLVKLTESYRFTSGSEVHPEPTSQDLVFHQSPGTPERVLGIFPVTPSMAFEAITLQRGVITVELQAPDAAAPVQVVAGSGGRVDDPSGMQFEAPPGALTQPTPISLSILHANGLGLTLPAGLEFLGGVSLSFSGRLALPGILSMPRPAAAAGVDRLLLVRAAEVEGETRLVLVARVRLDGDRLAADISVPGSADTLDGVREAGRYLFVQAPAPLGFSNGTVLGVTGQPFAGAFVTQDRLAVASFSGAAGRFVAAMPGGPAGHTALDLAKNDRGSATTTVVAGLTTPLDIMLVPQPPAVLSVTPADGAVNVALSDPVIVRFSEPVNPATVTVQALVLAGPSGPVAGTLALSSNDTVATLRPAAPLAANAEYAITIAATITDAAGYPLPAAVTARFTSLDTTPPPMPPAGSLSATVPGPGGTTTVSGTQATAGLHDTVTIVNVTRGTSTPVLVTPNGGFSAVVNAGLGDVLRVQITDQAGNDTVVDLPAFRQTNPDGSVSQVVGPGGGRVEGPGGLAADVVAGTFPNAAVITLQPLSEAEFPVTLTPEQASVYSYSGGFTIDFGGATPQHYINVSIPAAPGDKAEDRWMVSQVVQVDGEPRLNVVDTAKLIDGRVATSSPPCPGVTAAAMYGIHKSATTMALVYGSGAMRQTGDLYRAIASQPFGPTGTFVQPGGQYFDDSYNFCMPIMGQRISLSLNTVDIKIPLAPLGAKVVQVEVKNKETDRKNAWRFSRDELYVVVRTDTRPGDTHRVEAEFADGQRQNLPYAEEASDGSHTSFRIDLDAIPPKMTTLRVRSQQAGRDVSTPFALADLRVPLRVQGGKADGYEIFKYSGLSNAPVQVNPFDIVESAAGPKALVLRALKGTIDPTRAEVVAWNAAHPDNPIDTHGMYRTRVELRNTDDATSEEIPAAAIVDGGFTFNLDGDMTDRYRVVVSYEAPWPDSSIDIPVFTLTLSTSRNVVKVITLPAPPLDQPLKLPPLTDDTDPPGLASALASYQSFDPSKFLSFTFDESMDPDTVNAFVLSDAAGNPIPGRVLLSDLNRTLTFIPTTPLPLASSYTASFHGVKDLAGVEVESGMLTIPITTATPRTASTTAFENGMTPPKYPTALLDLQFMSVGDHRYAVGVTNEQDGYKLVTFDVTNPVSPTFVSGAFGGYFKSKLVLVPNANFNLAGAADRSDKKAGVNNCAAPPAARFQGTLAVAANANLYSSAVQFFDVTDPARVCMAGMNMLTANPDQLSSYTAPGTQHMIGFARAVAVLPAPNGPIAYTAVQGAGLFATEIAKHIPEVDPLTRQRGPMLGGDYSDVVRFGGRLLALETESGELQAIDPNLAIVGAFRVGAPTDPAHVMTYREGVPWDANGDGRVASGEFLNLAVVGTASSIKLVDVTRVEDMKLVAAVPMPAGGRVRGVDMDPATRRVWVVSTDGVHLVDLSGPASMGLADANSDGKDDRIAWSRAIAASAFGVRVDDRGYVYLATDVGMLVITLERPNLRGTAKYTHIPVNRVVGLDFEHAELRPVRHARVKLKNSTGNVIGETFTDDFGQYEFLAPTNADLTVQLDAAVGSPAGIDIEVSKFGADLETKGTLHSVERTVHTTATGEAVADIEATTEVQPGTRDYVAGKRAGGAFSLLDMVYGARRKILEVEPKAALKHLDILWEPEKQPGTACSPTTMFVNGVEASDTDEYDSPVILHEYSHHLMATLSRSDSTAGSHGPGEVLDARLAFDEGLVTALGNYLAGTPWYVDTGTATKKPTTGYSLEDGRCDPTVCTVGFFDEYGTAAVLWDLMDGVASDASPDRAPATDAASLGIGPLWAALAGPVKSTPAFVAMPSFLHHLLGPYAGFRDVRDRITDVLTHWKIDVPGDEFGDRVYVEVVPTLPGQPLAPVDTFPFGPPAGVPGPALGAALGTQDVNGDCVVWVDPADHSKGTLWNNKLYNRIILKVVVPAGGAGRYEMRIQKTTNPATTVQIDLFQGRPGIGSAPRVATASTTNVDATLLADLTPGTWLYVVMTGTPANFIATARKVS